MIIDFHTHIFSRAIRNNRDRYFSDEPAFKLLYESPKSKMVGAEELVATMDEQGVDVSVVFGFPWKNPDVYRSENDYVMDAVRRFPDRLVGFACFDPFAEPSADEVERCVEGGLSGVGELAFYRSGIDKEVRNALRPTMNACLDLDLPVLIHTNEPVGHRYPGKTPNTLRQIYDLAREFPENRIILAHWGGGIFFFELLKKEVRETLKNVWFDTAASPFLYKNDIYRVASALSGVEKILFGSDFPLIKPERYFTEVKTSGLPVSDQEKILGGNAKTVLGSHLIRTDSTGS